MLTQVFLEHSKGFFRNLDTGLINSLKNFDDRRNPFPRRGFVSGVAVRHQRASEIVT